VTSFAKANQTVLASQKYVFGKGGLGFNPNNKKISVSNHFHVSLKKQLIDLSKQRIVLCFYCMKMGHSVRFCRVRKFFVPRGVLKWVPKNFKDPNVPVNAHGPKFKRRRNLAP